MPAQGAVDSSVGLSVENIGGIDRTEVTLSPGVTVLTGRNATNRTSLLRAIKAALGSDEVALKGDAERGTVALELDGTTYTRTLTRRDGTVVFDGDPYLEDSRLADLFAFLLESNDARRAVERGDDLYDVIMRPIDTDEIDAEIDRLREERGQLETELEAIERRKQQLPELEAERTQLETAIEEKRAELEATREQLDELEGDRDGIEPLEDQFDELREARNRLERVRNDIEDEERVVEALRTDRDGLEADLDGLAAPADGAAADLESEIDRLRGRADAVESTVNQLQSAIQFNERLLDESPPELLEGLVEGEAGETSDSPTDRLVAGDDGLVCWTCGSQVSRGAVEETVGLLRDLHREKIDERNALKEEIDELRAEQKQVQRTEEERERLRRELEAVESDLAERTARIDELRGDAEALEDTVAELEAAVDERQTDDEDERLALHREVTELGVELDGLEADLADVEAEIDAIEERVDERDGIEARLEEIDAEIEERRSRIERLQADVVEQFNDHMEAILELLEFDNLERVWIERVEAEGTSPRGGPKQTFDLHVVRATDAGTVYEDTVDHLSESEREVVGLVFALSGYRVHEVHETVPFVLLDSLEALDASRIAVLVDYLAEQVDNLVVALLPEDAAAVDDRHHRLTAI